MLKSNCEDSFQACASRRFDTLVKKRPNGFEAPWATLTKHRGQPSPLCPRRALEIEPIMELVRISRNVFFEQKNPHREHLGKTQHFCWKPFSRFWLKQFGSSVVASGLPLQLRRRKWIALADRWMAPWPRPWRAWRAPCPRPTSTGSRVLIVRSRRPTRMCTSSPSLTRARIRWGGADLENNFTIKTNNNN